MIKSLQDELYQLENKQVKGEKLRVNIRWKLEGGKCSKTFFKVLKMQNMQTISELYTDDNKSKYSRNRKNILKSVKQFYEKLHTKVITFKAATTEFLSKIPNRLFIRFFLMNSLTFAGQKYI